MCLSDFGIYTKFYQKISVKLNHDGFNCLQLAKCAYSWLKLDKII